MNYPFSTIVQNYNVSAGRLAQLPCFMDQPEPPDGFRIVTFATPGILSGVLPNQNGPQFNAGNPCALQFDLTQLIQQATLSRARSIVVQTNVFPDNSSQSIYLSFDSGINIPVMPDINGYSQAAGYAAAGDACVCCDFLSASPIFGLLAIFGTQWSPQFTVSVANFRLSFSGYSSGAAIPGV